MPTTATAPHPGAIVPTLCDSIDIVVWFHQAIKATSAGASNSGANVIEFQKDREEWSDMTIVCLLEAYMEKFTQLNRGNLRGRD